MAFMQRQIQFGQWFAIEGEGTTYIPADLVSGSYANGTRWSDSDDDTENFCDMREAVKNYVEENRDDITAIEVFEGWGARLSAPGYMDCTPWSVFDTEQAAKDYLDECYGEEEEDAS